MIQLMHLVDLPCANPWLNGVASNYDRTRYRTLVTSIGPRCGLHDALEERGVQTFALDAAARHQIPRAVLGLAKLLRREQVDILQTHLFDPATIGLLAARIAGTPLRVVTRHHSDFTTVFRRPIHRRVDRWHALTADKVMAASAAVKNAMIDYEGVPAGRISVAHYGYDFALLRPRLTAAARQSVRQSIASGERLLIGTVARLSIEKGHEYLLTAAREVVQQRPDVCFVLIGSGPLKEKLVAQAEALGLSDHVRFLGWRPDALELMEAMDLIVHPTLHEAFCSVIIESMALERPLIATDVAAAPEQIDHGVTGLLVPARDPRSMAASILDLMSDRPRATQMGCLARHCVNERLNFPQMMKRYESLYTAWLNLKLTTSPSQAPKHSAV